MIGFALLFLFLACSTPVAAAGEPYRTYESGVTAFRDGDLVAAARSFEEALAAQPDYMPARFALAQAYHVLFQRSGLLYDDAVTAYEAVVATLDEELSPSSPRQQALLLFGQLLVSGGEYRRAFAPLQAFLKIRPDYYAREEVWNTIGVAHYYLDEYTEAVSAFERALDADPAYAAARFNLRSVFTRLLLFDVAMANRRIGRLDLALSKFDRLLNLAPRYLLAHLQKALVLRELGRLDEAEVVARRALTLGSNRKVFFELRELLGDILAAHGRSGEAVTQYRRCLQIFPGYVQIVEKIDALEQGQGRPKGQPEKQRRSFDVKSVAPMTKFPL
jgi:tetratricopeptide (TPR) repeat protein